MEEKDEIFNGLILQCPTCKNIIEVTEEDCEYFSTNPTNKIKCKCPICNNIISNI